MCGGKTFSRIFLVPDEWRGGCRLELFMREYMERNGSAQNSSKTSCKREARPYLHGTVSYRTRLKSRVNAPLNVLFFYYYYYYFNSLKTVAHSAKLVCTGPSIYKVNDKILQENYKKKQKKKGTCF